MGAHPYGLADGVTAHGLASLDLARARHLRRALAAAVERAIAVMDAIDAEAEDLEPEPDEDGDDAEALNEDGDPLDAGERDGWRRPRRAAPLGAPAHRAGGPAHG